MEENPAVILEKVERHVSKRLEKKLDPRMVFHNLAHTRLVVAEVTRLAETAHLGEKERLKLQLAGWFHDVGYLESDDHHERISAEMAERYLNKLGLPPFLVSEVKQIIVDTRIDCQPVHPLSPYLRDADLAHLAREDYREWADKLQSEWAKTGRLKPEQWRNTNRSFFQGHAYMTQAARSLYGEGKKRNLLDLEKTEINGTQPDEVDTSMSEPETKKTKKVPNRGRETLFRVTLKNHMELSKLADNKANIMLSINALIISIVLSMLLPKLDSNGYLTAPAFVLLGVCMVSVVLATLSTLPKVSKGSVTRESIKNKQANLLFFGNFHQMSEKEYAWGMEQLINDEEYLYGMMVKDLYYLGRVLDKKYRYLRITYQFFMIGIILSVLVFALQVFQM